MSAKPAADRLFQDEWPRGGRPPQGPQQEMCFERFPGWGMVMLLRFTAEIEDVPRVYYVLEGRLVLPDRTERRTRELVDVRHDADAQYRAIDLLNHYRDELDGWDARVRSFEVPVPAEQSQGATTA